MRTAEQSRLLAVENHTRLEREAREAAEKRDIEKTPAQLAVLSDAVDTAVALGKGWAEIEVDWDMTVSAYKTLVESGYEVRRTMNLVHKYVYEVRWDSAAWPTSVQPEDVVAVPGWPE